jgi:LysM repeat protein
MPGAAILGYHEVRSSETLYCVARAYGVLPSGIASENGIPYPYALKAGQLLAIPNLPWKSMPAGPTCQRQFISACRLTHVVQRGDTLYSIAARYQTTVWAIVNDNHIANPSAIMPGQKLCIR